MAPSDRQTPATHALFESASGYAIFEIKLHEKIGSSSKEVGDAVEDLSKFGKMVSLLSFSPFKSAAHALQNANDISEGKRVYRFSRAWPNRCCRHRKRTPFIPP